MEFQALQAATLLRRYKRFLADVELPGGEVITVHCPNTGAMTACAEPGSPVWLSTSAVKTRKYPHTWELVDTAQGLACIHSARANAVVREGFASGLIPGFEAYPRIKTEVKYGRGSRVDLLLESALEAEPEGMPEGELAPAPGRVFVEVKSVTLCRSDGVGLFPDAVSARGRRHLQELALVAAEPATRAVLLFCVFHNGINSVSAAAEIDPAYRDTLQAVLSAGVEVLAWRARVDPEGIQLEQALPFALDAPPRRARG